MANVKACIKFIFLNVLKDFFSMTKFDPLLFYGLVYLFELS